MPAEPRAAVPLHVEELGEGRPVLLVHGWSLSGRALGVVAEGLAPRCRVLLADLRGHGRSPAPAHGYQVEDHAADLLALLERRGLMGRSGPDRPLLVGWSLGALAVLAALPGLGEQVAGAALLSGTPRFCLAPDWPHGLPGSTVAALAGRLERRPVQTLRRFFGGMFAPGEIEDAPMVMLATHLVDGLPPDPAAARASLDGLAQADLRHLCAAVRVPTLLLHGDRDPVCLPGASTWLAGQLPGARLELLAGAGHAPQLSRPRAVIDALHRFLRELA
jgi:pimeloyl-[acyl-carrier protein] methyl ester esterase